ncbi:MAG: mechanosensitive ion channel, partial [Myxococcales bacterium]|nr:mechanosensitive ion channel [Myxococcales bacterium]
MLPDWLRELVDFVPAGVAVVVAVVTLLVARALLDRAAKRRSTTPGVRSNAIMLALTLAAIVLVIVLLPISDAAREQLLSFLGILISATIALSSTTFLGNAMAGLMLRALRNFRPGDFIRVGDHFGRVTERGIFHVELQTEDRDLTTLPNLHLVNNPVTVVRASGTILSANVSLGYDVAHPRAEKLMLEAAEAAGLRDGFVHITELGDHAVSYRVAGLLTEV